MLRYADFRRHIKYRDFSSLLGFPSTRKTRSPNDIALLISRLDEQRALNAFITLPEKLRVTVFAYLPFEIQRQLIKGISKDKSILILNHLESDDRFNFFSKLESSEQYEFLDLLTQKAKLETLHFIEYPSNSIALLVNTEFITLHSDMSIAEAILHIRAKHKDSDTSDILYVTTPEGLLIDDIPIRRLVLNDADKKIKDILDGFCVTLNLNDTREMAIDRFKTYDRVALPVVNNQNAMVGVLTIDDVMDIAEQQDTKDIQKFGGLESLDYPYVHTSFPSLIQKRAGWLIILFVSEMLTATAMGYFEVEISKAVVLALFVPLIISSGGNSGSQAATLIIRAMAVKELSISDWWFVMRREFLAGLTLGIVLGVIGFVRIALWQYFHWYDYGQYWVIVALTVLFSLIGIVLWGTVSGSMVPILLKKFGFDPATSSAPFVATLVDVTGLVIYFTVAAIMLRGTLL